MNPVRMWMHDLADGSRVNAVIPPISLIGPTLTIRKFSKVPITLEQLVQFGTLTPESLQFLKACVEARIKYCYFWWYWFWQDYIPEYPFWLYPK